ncbi:MAG: carboxylesterase family protein [Woeseiaceae bacterium]|nr:carboxylesterase family protein [Woeseiaceae bacterium]
MPRFALLLAVFVVVTACPAPADSPPAARAGGEQLQGKWVGDDQAIAAFLGVPFAAPPVGDLRWRAPRAHAPRAGVRSATTFAPACMQTDYIVDWYVDIAKAFGRGEDVVERPRGVSEDCLYLNVWTPALDGELPVMVWLHGGANQGGWSYEPNYIGTALASRGVVVVSIAYRLGALGFFAHPQLGNEPDEAAANFGWLDQLHALRWLHENAGAFGGDPSNMTVFGESAGAGDLLNMIVAGPQRAPVRRFIAQSQATDIAARASLADERRNGLRLADALGIADDGNAMARLRDVSALEIVTTAESVLADHYYDVVLDGDTFAETPLDYVNRHAGDAVPAGIDLLAGSNADEWYMYLDATTAWSDVDAWLARTLSGREAALRAALANITDPRRALDRLQTAYEMDCPLQRLANRLAAGGGRAFVYRFDRVREGAGGERLGSYHGAEIPYVFGTHDIWLPTTPADRELTAAMMDSWVSFARTGDPNTGSTPRWPVYDAGSQQVMRLGTTRHVATADNALLCELMAPGLANE